jgi:L-serine dehydratase
MIGPSSSHTAGAVRLGLLARRILGEGAVRAHIELYGSFARTYKGHGTDLALLAGLLGWSPDDERIPRAFAAARAAGLEFSFQPVDSDEFVHPNTAVFNLTARTGLSCRIAGSSLGGGRILINSIDDFPLELSGELSALLTIHHDKPGIVSLVSGILAEIGTNIAAMRVFRQQKGGLAAMLIETDQPIQASIAPIISAKTGIESVRLITGLSVR